jgi:CheY-like chemotaxis protein
VVEDNPTARELLSVYLEEAGYGVQVVARVTDVVPWAREHRPVAITLDLMLQDGLAWPALQQLKTDARTRDIPVIIVSILDEQPTGFALGASAYLTKPISRQELLATLERVVARRPVAAGGTPGGTAAAQPSGAPRVLAVDDHPEALELISVLLEGSEYHFSRASTGAEALILLAGERPDVLIVDLMMEPLSGFDVIAAVAADPETHAIPIIVLTARDLTMEDHARLQGHVASIVSKHAFSREHFLGELRRAAQAHAPAEGERIYVS